jgi:hypothetical protein
MRRTVSEARVGDNQVRYRTRIEDDGSQQNSWEARRKLLDLLGTILQSPDLMNCGFNTPQKLSIYHSGTGWVLEAEATVEVEA